jgi:hypothetical protein
MARLNPLPRDIDDFQSAAQGGGRFAVLLNDERV